MGNNEQIRAFESQWRLARGLSCDLLRSLEDSDLSFSPGDRVGPLWKQLEGATHHLPAVYSCAHSSNTRACANVRLEMP
jgi:hypothetical protein